MDDKRDNAVENFLNNELLEICAHYGIDPLGDYTPSESASSFDLLLEDNLEDVFDESVVDVKEKSTISKSIRVIKGNSIDLNKVFAIEKIERDHNGKITYGIKFIFKGKNKYYRIVWFNENVTQRDRTYEQENKIWQQQNEK